MSGCIAIEGGATLSVLASRSGRCRIAAAAAVMCLVSSVGAQMQAEGGSMADRRTAVSAENRSPEAQAHVERLAILTQEKNKLLAQRQQLEPSGDKPAMARLEADLKGIDREIARAVKEPVYEMKRAPAGPAPSASAPASAVNPTQPSTPEVIVSYESWDVFKNFGKKESKQ